MTWATPIAARKITGWKVELGMLSLSDHNYITFKIGIEGEVVRRTAQNKSEGGNEKGDNNRSVRWKMETLDQETFDQVLEWKCSERTEKGDVEKDAEWIHRTMIEAADVSMQRASKRAGNKKQVYWWNDDIAKVRSKCIPDRRKWSRVKTKKKKAERKHGEHAEEAEANLHRLERCYKNSRKNVVKTIYKAKEAAWKELILK